jgi:hypothetical protein
MMHDAAARSHPLQIARAQKALIAKAIAMFHRACQHIGDGFNAAMWVPWKATDIIGRIITDRWRRYRQSRKPGAV